MNKSLDDIEKRLLSDLKPILVTLYPRYKVEGNEFLIGNVEGEEGKSLKINLKSGLWADFSGHGRGRILKLFAYRHGGDFHKGLLEIYQLLKIPQPPKSNKFKPPKKEWFEDLDYRATPIQYLIRDRGIPRSILSACGVRCTKTEYVFRGFDEHAKIAYAQYIKRVGDEKGVRFSDKAKLCLWGMHSMKELNTGGSVIITEGVIDAMTFRSADMFAVSIPSGIKNTNWIQLSWDWLSQFETIYLAFDWDEAAQETIVEIASRLGIYRCKKVVIPEKDANETQLQHSDTWPQLLKKYIDEAKDFMPPARITAREAKSRVETYMSQGEIMNMGQLLLGWEFAPTETKRHPLNFRFRSGEQTIWSGYTGSGKSSVLFQHIAYAIFVQGETVALAALEEQFEKVITTIIKIALGKFPKIGSREYEAAYEILADKLIIHNVLGIEKLSSVLEFFEYASKKDGAKHCILDSIMCTDVDVDSDKATVNNMMKTIIESLARSGSHYHIVAHCTKGNDEDYKEIPRVNTVKGIQEITARAHNVIFVWRNKPKEASIEGSIHKNQPEEARRKEREMPDTIIKVAKNRNGKVLGQIKAWFSFYSDRFRPEYEGTSDRPYFVCEDSGPD